MTITAKTAAEPCIEVCWDDESVCYYDSISEAAECLDLPEDDIRVGLEGKQLSDQFTIKYRGGYGCAACLLNGIDIEEREILTWQDALKSEMAKAPRATQALWLRGQLLMEEGRIMRLDAERRHMIEVHFAARACTCEGACCLRGCGQPYVRPPQAICN